MKRSIKIPGTPVKVIGTFVKTAPANVRPSTDPTSTVNVTTSHLGN